MANLGNASLILTTNFTELSNGLKAASGKIDSWGKAVTGRFQAVGGRIGGAIGGIFGKAGGQLGASLGSGALGAVSKIGGVAVMALGATVGAAVGIASAAMDDIKDLASQNDLAASLGVSAEAFTGLAGAAKQYGVDTNGVFEGLVSLSTKANEALKGGDLGATFRKLGIDVQQFAALNPGDQFTQLHAALQSVQNPAERTRILMATMGEEAGKKMAPLLNKSTDELKKLTGQFAVSNAEMQKIKAADTAMKSVTASMQALWRRVVVAIAPVIEAVANKLTRAFEIFAPVADWVLRALSTHWGIIIDIVGEAIDAIGEVISEVGRWVGSLLGLENVTVTIEEVVVGVWRAIGIAGAYAWDTIKAGMGIVAIGVGYLVKGVAGLIDVFAEVVGIAKELPDDLRPAGLDNFIKGVEEVRDSVRDTGNEIKKWGVDAVDNFGKSADKVRAWFDKRKDKKAAPDAGVAKAFNNANPVTLPVKYEAVGVALKGSKEAYSIEARFRTENMLNPQLDAQQKQLKEQQRGNGLLKDVVDAVKGIGVGALKIF